MILGREWQKYILMWQGLGNNCPGLLYTMASANLDTLTMIMRSASRLHRRDFKITAPPLPPSPAQLNVCRLSRQHFDCSLRVWSFLLATSLLSCWVISEWRIKKQGMKIMKGSLDGWDIVMDPAARQLYVLIIRRDSPGFMSSSQQVTSVSTLSNNLR